MFVVEESLFGLLDPEYLLARLNIPQNLDLRHPYCQNIKKKHMSNTVAHTNFGTFYYDNCVHIWSSPYMNGRCFKCRCIPVALQ